MQGELTTLTPLIRPWSMEPEYINLIRLLNEEGVDDLRDLEHHQGEL